MESDKTSEIVEGPVCDPDAARETRKLRHWIIKGVFLLISFIVVLVVTAVVYDFVFRDGDIDETLLGNFLNSLIKILEVMFQESLSYKV